MVKNTFILAGLTNKYKTYNEGVSLPICAVLKLQWAMSLAIVIMETPGT